MTDPILTRDHILKRHAEIGHILGSCSLEADAILTLHDEQWNQVEALLAEHDSQQAMIVRLQEQVKGIACEVCWTTSWVPIATKVEADGVNTKQDGSGNLTRCDYCWHTER